MTVVEEAILKRWQQLREQNIAPQNRLNDPTILKLERELQAIRDCIERTK